MQELNCGVLIIGGGPGGYVCAIRAGQLGLDVVLVEQDRPGGTCLTVGCIPSKALIHAAGEYERIATAVKVPMAGIGSRGATLDFAQTQGWKEEVVTKLTTGVAGLLRKAKVRVIRGQAAVRDGKSAIVTTAEVRQMITCEHLVLATGSVPAELPHLPFGGDILSSTDALALTELPASLAVVGGGYIGLELGTAFAKLGVQVTVVEAGPRILPAWDADLTAPVLRRLEKLGVRVLTGAQAGAFSEGSLQVRQGDQTLGIAAEKVLVTVGRRPRAQSAGLAALQLAMDGPFIRINSQCRTSMSGVYAIGDVTGEPMLAHRAMAQGEALAERLAGKGSPWDHRAMPAVCFTDPEIVSVGLSPEAAKAAHGEVRVASFPFAANGKALAEEDTAGFVRVVSDAQGREILGIQAVGCGVSELAAGFALALEMGATLADVAATIHAHPTRGEAFREAALIALGKGLHL